MPPNGLSSTRTDEAGSLVNNQVVEICIEGSAARRRLALTSIRAKGLRVLPGMQAAFVDFIGTDKGQRSL